MGIYTLRRLLMLIPILVGVRIVTFLAIHLAPGDPGAQILADNANREAAENMRQQLGLNDPLPVQYVHWFGGVLRGDFGRSLLTNVPAREEILALFPGAVQREIAGLVVSIGLGVPLGILAAVSRYRWVDSLIMFFALG